MSKISARKREIVQQKEQQGEQLHHFYDDPLADVALISNDGMVLKHYSNLLRKNSGFFKDLFTLPACPAGSTSARSSADPPFQLPLDSSPGSIVTYLDILHARGASLPLIDVNAFEEQYNLAIFLDDRSLAERSLHHYHTNIEYDGFIALRLADRHPADEARLLAMGLKKIFHQPYGSPADAAAYAKYMADIRALPPRYLAEIAAKTFFRPLSTSSLCFVK